MVSATTSSSTVVCGRTMRRAEGHGGTYGVVLTSKDSPTQTPAAMKFLESCSVFLRHAQVKRRHCRQTIWAFDIDSVDSIEKSAQVACVVVACRSFWTLLASCPQVETELALQ